jgi:flagellar protein FlgJ
MEISAFQPQVNAAELPLEELAANKNVSDQAKVAETCRQFEAVLVRQILSEARKPMAASTSGMDGSSAGVYADMVNSQLADVISRGGGIGLARSLQTQLARQVLAPGKNGAAAAAANVPAASVSAGGAASGQAASVPKSKLMTR